MHSAEKEGWARELNLDLVQLSWHISRFYAHSLSYPQPRNTCRLPSWLRGEGGIHTFQSASLRTRAPDLIQHPASCRAHLGQGEEVELHPEGVWRASPVGTRSPGVLQVPGALHLPQGAEENVGAVTAGMLPTKPTPPPGHRWGAASLPVGV